jgi:hypothetical protein
MDWKDIAPAVGKAAPILGTLLAGATGGVSVAVGALISAALGTVNTPDAISTAIATDPQAALKLAPFESDNKIKLQAMVFAHAEVLIAEGTKAIQADVDDRKNARDTAVAGATTLPLFIMSCILITITLGTEITVLFHGLPANVDPLIVGRVLGLMDAVALMVLTFNYGSSTGSKRATELLAQSAPVSPTNAP